MTKVEILDLINNHSKWTKDLSGKDLWSYLKVTEFISIGRQRYDWAIFKRNKNYKFYFVEKYKEIPMGLVNDLYNMLMDLEK